MRTLRARLSVPPQLRGTFVYLSAVTAAQAASFVLLPIVTRFLSTGQYGEYAVGLAVANLVGMFGSSWVRNVGFRFYFDARQAGRSRGFTLGLALLQSVVVAVVFGLVMLVSALTTPLASTSTLLAAGLMVLVTDVGTLTVTLVRAEQRSGRFALAEFGSAGTRILGTTVGLLLGLRSPAFLFLAAAVASLVQAGVGLAALAPRLSGALRLDLGALWEVAKRGPSALPFSVGEWLNLLADRLIVRALTSAAVVGVYSAGQTLGFRVIAGIVQAVFMMAWPDVLNAWSEGGVARARRAVTRYIETYLMLTVGPTVAMVLYAGTLTHVLGSSFREGAVPVVAMIAIASWAQGFGVCFNRHFEMRKRYWALSTISLAGAALNIGLTFRLVPRFLGPGSAAATMLAQLAVMLTFILLRDRDLVAFPAGRALTVGLAAALAAAVAWPLLGQTLPGLVTFAALYLVGIGLAWLKRSRPAAAPRIEGGRPAATAGGEEGGRKG